MATTRFAITLGLVAASLALSACSQEDYYCDESGCYLCDGVGCRSIDPPGRTSCEGDCDCPGGTLCSTLGCATTCDADADCPRGTRCATGMCLAPRETGATATGECAPCTTDAECADEGDGFVCIAGACRPPARPQCEADADCTAPATCVDGECRTPDETCRFSAECGPGRVCVNEHCTTQCDATRPCPTGSTCEGGFCVEVPPPTGCGTGGMCPAGDICIDGACWDGCTTSAECGEGRYCAPDGRCRHDDRPQPVSSCIAPARAVDGVCRTPCSSSTECRTFDEQLTFCGTDMLCYTTNEATSDCAQQSECNPDESCIDGTCR